MMRCQKIILELSNYLDNEMDSSLRMEFEEHMGRCPNCRVIIDTTRQTIEVYRGCQPIPLPEHLHNKLRETLHRHYQSQKPSE